MSFSSKSDLSDKEFFLFRRLVYEKSGICLHKGKKELLRSRLARRIRELGLLSFYQYFKLLTDEGFEDELMYMLDAISTNLTGFFREKYHFEFLKDFLFPLFYKNNKRKLDIWSAGCSSGEEAYSIAISFCEALKPGVFFKAEILGTDLSDTMLKKAYQAVYSYSAVSDLPEDILFKYFYKGQESMETYVKIKPEIQNMVKFRRFNLMKDFYPGMSFDLVFCRNVMIYFDKPTQKDLVEKFYKVLKPGGYFFIGHSESLIGIEHDFKYLMPTIYYKDV